MVRKATEQDVKSMAPRLRDEDMAEITASTGRPPVTALGWGFAHSERCLTVEYNGKPAAMFGVIPSPTAMPRLGSVWLLGTDDIPLFSKTFLRHSRGWLREVTRGFDVVGNFVDERNKAHVRWIEWLGFTFVKRHERYGKLGVPFLEFVKMVDDEE